MSIEFDPSLLLEVMPRGDAITLAGMIVEDLRRNQALLKRAAVGDHASAARAAHSLVSVVASVGCESVAHQAAVTDTLCRARDADAARAAADLDAAIDAVVDALNSWRGATGAPAQASVSRR
jgi:hypothetical protein